MNLERGSRLGRFVIRRRIGVGGMGAVYRAFDTVLRRQVAIKTVLTETTDADGLARFRREALSISRLDDPHIVKLIDFVEGNPERGEQPFMVMELLQGRDLHSVIRSGPIEISRVVDIMLQTCAAVGACHLLGFVHRDLKAKNIFLTEYNQIETAKVLDFGVAKLWSESRSDPEVTRKGSVFGTPEYLAPEVFRGTVAGPKTDQYALGVLLYSALTGGRKPFSLEKEHEYPELRLWQAIVKGDHPRLSAYRPNLPAELELVVERAMHRDPERRFPSVHRLGEALLRWASERARLHWTDYFTSVPKPPPIHSTDIAPELVEHARSIIALRRSTRPTVLAKVAQTRLVSHDELSEHSTIVRVDRGPEGVDPAASEGIPTARVDCQTAYIRLELEELSTIAVGWTKSNSVDVGPGTGSSSPGASPSSSPAARPRVPIRLIVRHPATCVAITVGSVVLAIALALAVRRHSSVRLAGVSAPADIQRRTRAPSLVRHAMSPTVKRVDQMAQVAASVLASWPMGAPPTPIADVVSASTAKRVFHRRRPAPLVDQNGVWIPSE